MPNKTLTAKEHFNLANQYLAVYIIINQELQNPSTTLSPAELSDLYQGSKPLIKIAQEFQKMAFRAMAVDLHSSVEDLESSVEAAAKTISNIVIVGKVIEIVADLVAIGVVVAVPDPKITSLTVIPALVKELYEDVNDLAEG
ncbi:hypothetical protein [Pseudomonas brassicacearum]|uniref:Uncharacterized protein n=1 Tax=Pseudomonas brassicacearum subsp. neoaurantiaca TaxID=494916 RepID=A0A7V8RHM5_9PSED|nr:hypothetical protein [Pseudomonas brassicacearum]MBA1376676.1 hypothetical protein [Pseudomonas brassicacearum subsp. neoaurantiaca]